MINNNKYIKGSKGVPPPKTPMRLVLGWERFGPRTLVRLECGHTLTKTEGYLIPVRARCRICEQKGHH